MTKTNVQPTPSNSQHHDTPLLFAPSGANHEQGLGQARPNKITSKLARVADVKSRWSTTFSKIENLWPRDGSCPLQLRSKSTLDKCFRIVKTQKISRGTLLMYGSHRSHRTQFLPLFCSGVGWKAGITFGRLIKFSRYVSHKEKYRPRSAAMILSGETAAK